MFPVILFLLLLSGGVFGAANATPEACFEIGGHGQAVQSWNRSLTGAEHAFLSETRWESDPAVPPVRVSVCREDEAPSLSVDAIEGGGVSVMLRLSPSTNDPRNPPLVAASLLLRTYYASSPPVPGAPVPRYPDWVLRGLGSLMFVSGGAGMALPGGDRAPELEEFLRERAPATDQPSLLSYYDRRASVLLHAGLRDEGGRKAFRDWVGSNTPDSSPWIPDSWVSGWDAKALERRWVLGLHASAIADGPRVVAPSSAEATLALYGTIMGDSLGGVIPLADLRAKRGGGMLIDQRAEKLGALRLKANPLVVPLIDETMKFLTAAHRMPPAAIRREEARIRELAADVRSRSTQITDYLNWYEAAKSDVRSGLFDGYLSSRTPQSRKGPLGRAVDAVESRGW